MLRSIMHFARRKQQFYEVEGRIYKYKHLNLCFISSRFLFYNPQHQSLRYSNPKPIHTYIHTIRSYLVLIKLQSFFHFRLEGNLYIFLLTLCVSISMQFQLQALDFIQLTNFRFFIQRKIVVICSFIYFLYINCLKCLFFTLIVYQLHCVNFVIYVDHI